MSNFSEAAAAVRQPKMSLEGVENFSIYTLPLFFLSSVNETLLFFIMFRLIVFSLLSPLVVMISTGPEKERKREGKNEKVSLSFSTFVAC